MSYSHFNTFDVPLLKKAGSSLRDIAKTKATASSKMSQNEVDYVVDQINQRPRKCLNWKTARELFPEEVLHLG